MSEKTILVVEDNEMNLKLLSHLLKLGKYKHLEAINGEEGIKIAKEHKPDLILMDIQLPKMDGLSATRVIKSDPEMANIPVVALTAHAMQGDKQKCIEAGCNGYITKPIDTRSFLSEISDIFSKVTSNTKESIEKPLSPVPRILIVDDDPKNVKLIAGYLYKENYELMTAYSGEEAIDLARNKKPELILLDIMMPGKDGFTVTKELKADKETASIPIIMVTALSSTQDKVKGLEAGAEEFLSKPVNREEIRTRIASVLKLKQYRTQLDIRKKTECSLQIEKVHNKKELRQKDLPKVLIVDDDPNEQKLLLNYLKDENFHILTESNGKEGLKTALQEKVDLIILDVLLPKMDGFMVCRRIKQSKETRDIQVVLITCLDDMESRIKGVEIGADDFLVKPLESRELVARSRTLIKKKGYIDRLHEHCERAISSAIMDGLTGLYNNAYFKQFLELEIKRCSREKHPLSLLMMDIDEFKTINDTIGHYKGDEVLRKVAEIIQSSIREIDLAARYGGDEFAIVFPYTHIEGALLAAERIHRNLTSDKITVEGIEKAFSINTSIGLSTYPDSAESLVEMINIADAMLYRAKKNGKNRIEIHRPEPEGGFLKMVAKS